MSWFKSVTGFVQELLNENEKSRKAEADRQNAQRDHLFKKDEERALKAREKITVLHVTAYQIMKRPELLAGVEKCLKACAADTRNLRRWDITDCVEKLLPDFKQRLINGNDEVTFFCYDYDGSELEAINQGLIQALQEHFSKLGVRIERGSRLWRYKDTVEYQTSYSVPTQVTRPVMRPSIIASW